MTLSRGLRLIALLVPVALFGQNQATQVNLPDDGLNLRFANGIAAIAEDKVITVDDIRREVAPFVERIKSAGKTEQEFYQALQRAQEDALQDLIDRVLIVKEFYKDEKRRVPANYIDQQVSEIIATDFEGDRSKFLAYLRSRGISQKDHRKEVEERMIYDYMRGQQRKSASTISPVKIETFYNENRERFFQEDAAQLRLIQVTRAADETDDSLKARAEEVMGQLRSGASFADVARIYSQDSRKAKGGDWGWQRKSDLRKEFSDVLFTLEKGKFSEPVLVTEGAFILYVEDRKHAGILPISEVRDHIERTLRDQALRQAQEKWLEKLRRNGYVRMF
jgi:peptidyl-prolyl cis-trans isomerase SurA